MNGCNKKQYRPTVDDTKVPCSTYMSTDCIYPGDKVRVESLGLSPNCDMSDVIFNYNHGGRVAARIRNNTLKLSLNDVCMEMDAFLGGTEYGRNLLEEIRGGYIDKMSFAFVVAEDGDEYDPATHTRTITRIKKLYDVSAVDIPAYDTTSISARSFFEVEYEKEKRALEQARLREICIAKSKI